MANYLCVSVLFLLGLLPMATSVAGDRLLERPPNVIIVLVDDLGYGDLASYGHPTMATPDLDRMAAEGLRFTQFYAAAPTCTPSRAALLTGRLPVRNGMTDENLPVLFPFSSGGLPSEELTLAEALADEGYSTAMIGKWHLGHQPRHLPLRHGFEYFFGVPYSNDMEVENRGDPPLPLYRNDVVLEQPVDQRTLTRRYTQEALQFIRQHTDEPFLLYLAHTFPHVPLHASEAFEGISQRGRYGDVVEELDWSTGRILDELRKLDLARQTLVIFTSDNGPAIHKGVNGGSAGSLRGRKGTTWEGGVRVPAIFWWPGAISASAISREPATMLDLLPTVVSLAGGTLPSDRAFDGRDISLLLFTDTAEAERSLPPNSAAPDESQNQIRSSKTLAAGPTIFYYSGPRLFAIRHGPWKAHFLTRDRRWRTAAEAHEPPLLFHLGHDPSERFDVASQHSDVVEEMKRIRDVHMESITKAPSQLARRNSDSGGD